MNTRTSLEHTLEIHNVAVGLRLVKCLIPSSIVFRAYHFFKKALAFDILIPSSMERTAQVNNAGCLFKISSPFIRERSSCAFDILGKEMAAY